jgi:glutathione S-transferase
MSAIKLHVIKPSVNNMTARVFIRAAKLDFTEDDVYGKTRTADFLAKNPAHLTPTMEAPGLPKGVMWESCAIMQYLCNKHRLDKFYPTEPEKRAMVDSAMFYIVGTLYPYIVASPRQVLSDRARKAGDGGQRHVLYCRHALSLYRTLDLWRARLPAISRRGRRQRCDRRGEGEGAEGSG